MGSVHSGSVGAGASSQSNDANSAHEDLEMAEALPQLGQDRKSEPFLYAPVGNDRRGATVTVLSMFARLGVDPWGEAAGLASLPEGAARKRLGALIARFTDVPIPGATRSQAVSRLLAVLPRSEKVAPGNRLLQPAGPRAKLIYWLVAIGYWLAYVGLYTPGN